MASKKKITKKITPKDFVGDVLYSPSSQNVPLNAVPSVIEEPKEVTEPIPDDKTKKSKSEEHLGGEETLQSIAIEPTRKTLKFRSAAFRLRHRFHRDQVNYRTMLKNMREEIIDLISYAKDWKNNLAYLKMREGNENSEGTVKWASSNKIKCSYGHDSIPQYMVSGLIKEVKEIDGEYAIQSSVTKYSCSPEKDEGAVFKDFIEYNVYSYLKVIYVSYANLFRSINKARRYPQIAAEKEAGVRKFGTESSITDSPVKMLDDITKNLRGTFLELAKGESVENDNVKNNSKSISEVLKNLRKIVFGVK